MLICPQFDAQPVLAAFLLLPPVSIVPVRLRFTVAVKDVPPSVLDMPCKVDGIGAICPTRLSSVSSTLMTSNCYGTGFSIFIVLMTSSSILVNVNGNASLNALFSAHNGENFGISKSWSLYNRFLDIFP